MFHTQVDSIRQTSQTQASQNVNALWQTLRIKKYFCLGLICLMTATGCSSFERDWKSAQQYAYGCNDISGIWEGSWHSNHNGHEGKLRAIITKQDENFYHAQFKAIYGHIIPFEFELPLSVSEDGGVFTMEGNADLGWIASGVFTYNGEATPNEFFANFCARKDHGSFQMKRIWSCHQCYDDEVWCAGYEEAPTETTLSRLKSSMKVPTIMRDAVEFTSLKQFREAEDYFDID